MTVCFWGCDYKYETESVLKLFILLDKFTFLYEKDPEEDEYVILAAKDDVLSVSVSYLGKKSEKQTAMGNGGYTDEQNLCRMLFGILEDITDIHPAWGCLTGIRPVRKVNALLSEDKSKEEIFSKFKEQYFVSDRKLELAYKIAEVQEKALQSYKRNSFSLYLAIPFCPARCSYCSFVSHSIKSQSAKKLIPEYTEKICDELEFISEQVRKYGLDIDTVYIGGGTPTAIPAGDLDRIMKKTTECFDLSSLREYTVEAGRADTITEEKLSVIKNNGATRISINPQSMVDSVLEKAGRHHTAQQVIDSFRLARSMGFDNINMDTIAGLPGDTVDGFRYTIDTLTDLDLEDITVHTLTVKRSAELFADSENALKSIDTENIDKMVNYAEEKLMEKGYLPYYLYRQKNTIGNLENVGFAKPGAVSLYNIYIMEELQTILAAGASGSTKIVNNDTNEIIRLINYKYPYEYISRFDKLIEKKKNLFDEVFGKDVK